MNKTPFTVGRDDEGKLCVSGPVPGAGWYGGLLFPYTRFETQETADQAIKLMNEAYTSGFERAQFLVRQAIGA